MPYHPEPAEPGAGPAVAAAGRTLHRGHVEAGVTTLGRLREDGPFAPIFTSLGYGTGAEPLADALLRHESVG